MSHVQVKEPRLQARGGHSATAFAHTSALTEVVLFGGCPKVPKKYTNQPDIPQKANTTVLRFGEFPRVHVSWKT